MSYKLTGQVKVDGQVKLSPTGPLLGQYPFDDYDVLSSSVARTFQGTAIAINGVTTVDGHTALDLQMNSFPNDSAVTIDLPEDIVVTKVHIKILSSVSNNNNYFEFLPYKISGRYNEDGGGNVNDLLNTNNFIDTGGGFYVPTASTTAIDIKAIYQNATNQIYFGFNTSNMGTLRVGFFVEQAVV